MSRGRLEEGDGAASLVAPWFRPLVLRGRGEGTLLRGSDRFPDLDSPLQGHRIVVDDGGRDRQTIGAVAMVIAPGKGDFLDVPACRRGIILATVDGTGGDEDELQDHRQ